MQKKNLLYIGNKIAVHGRPPTSIDVLSKWLQEEGYTILTSSSKKNRILRFLDMVFTTIKNRSNIDLVLIDTYSTQNFYYALIIAALCNFFKLPYIPILHGGNLPDRLKRNKKFSLFLFGKAKTNVAPSKYIMDQFKLNGFQNITYIPNTIEIEKYPFLPRKKIQPKLLWVRSFSEIYNPLLALQIVEQLKNEGLNVSLCMVGPEKDGSLARCKKVSHDLNLPIKFTGKLEKEEWIELSKAYDIFINTTNFDNMPVSVMEAMALGLPVVSTHVGGLPYLISSGQDGLLVPPNSPDNLVVAIKKLLSDPLMAETLALQARAKIEKFDWKQVKHSWITLLDS